MFILKYYVFLFASCLMEMAFFVDSHFGCPFHTYHQPHCRNHPPFPVPPLPPTPSPLHMHKLALPPTPSLPHKSALLPAPSPLHKPVLPATLSPSRRSNDNFIDTGKSCAPPKQECDLKNSYYSYNGSCNNLQNPSWGQFGTQYVRYLPANYADTKCGLRKASNGQDLPLARNIRATILEDHELPSKKFNILYYGFGQWVDHDVTGFQPMETRNPCCADGRLAKPQSEKCLPLVIPEKDKFYSKFQVTCLDFKRANNTHTLNCDLDEPCVPINFQTAVLDLSIFYGSKSRTVADIRLFKGGSLKFTNNSMTKYQSFPPVVSGMTNCPVGGIDNQMGGYCFKTGDERINQNPEITIIEIIFYKLHQLIASFLGASKLNDEEIFQETRRFLIAAYQHIIYSEFVPLTVGHRATENFDLLPLKEGYAVYKPYVNPQTLVEYSFAVGRAPHSLIKGTITYWDRGVAKTYSLRDKYFNQRFLLNKNIFEFLLRSYVQTESNAQDAYGSQETSNFLLFNKTVGYGSDLKAIDILRGLDAGLPTYNAVRLGIGLSKLNTFEDLIGDISHEEAVVKLKSVYNSVDDIDLYVGGLLEKPKHNSTFGATFTHILAESFYRWKFGDRLYYEFAEAGFSTDELKEIRKISFAFLLCLVSPGEKVPKNAFLIPSESNPLVDCPAIVRNGPNLKLWKTLHSTRFR